MTVSSTARRLADTAVNATAVRGGGGALCGEPAAADRLRRRRRAGGVAAGRGSQALLSGDGAESTFVPGAFQPAPPVQHRNRWADRLCGATTTYTACMCVVWLTVCVWWWRRRRGGQPVCGSAGLPIDVLRDRGRSRDTHPPGSPRSPARPPARPPSPSSTHTTCALPPRWTLHVCM